ncbi:hypothetical protein [Jeongeupia naejangsanensis]|uniref:Uncharacterized protein n=1 Tax=Jeongeupia naejangsanensis TaxID=613195 RepID=A0ABS2BQB1_9NEIS|nr:hypothetical protein [Jeongeupia naejangsanensis]MBM3117807.1 hypothetical protein [Jeongeupia naejangsanensis]
MKKTLATLLTAMFAFASVGAFAGAEGQAGQEQAVESGKAPATNHAKKTKKKKASAAASGAAETKNNAELRKEAGPK